MLSFSESASDKPIIHDLIRQYDICINIIKAEMSPGMTGSMLAEFEASEPNIASALGFLSGQGVETALVTDKIIFRNEKCVHCGSCASACFTQALTIGSPDWKLSFRRENCILCRLCIAVCPQRLFSIAAE